MDLSTSAKTATTTTKAITTKPTKSFTACEPKTTMNNGNRWKSLLDQLAHLCGRLIEAEGLTSTAMGSKGIGSINGGTTTVTATAYSNGTHRDREDSEAASSSSSIVRQLRELTASIDGQMLNFRPVDHRRLWADTFFTPVVERPNLFEMSIFGFRLAGHQIPLHDHPRMFGFIRPLHGRIRLSSYSWLELSEERQLLMVKQQQQQIGTGNGTGNASSPHANGTMASTAAGLRPARFEGQLILSTPPPERCGATRVALLEPGTANLHSIQALDDGATFFDLLVPGYKADNRVCTYYSIVGQREEPKIGDIVWLAGSDRMEENFSMQEYVQTASIGR